MIDEYLLRVVGSVALPEPLELSHEYLVSIRGQIDGERKKDNHDGTFDIVYTLRGERMELLTDKGKQIVSKDKSSPSQKFRYRLLKLKEELGITGDPDEWYTQIMSRLSHHLPDILIWLEKR